MIPHIGTMDEMLCLLAEPPSPLGQPWRKSQYIRPKGKLWQSYERCVSPAQIETGKVLGAKK